MDTSWTPGNIALLMGGVAAIVTSLLTGVANLIVAWRTERKMDGLLDLRIAAAVAEGNLTGRHELRSEQADRRVVAVAAEKESVASDKEIVRADAEADAQSKAKVRAIETKA